jgi:hypothetical protein
MKKLLSLLAIFLLVLSCSSDETSTPVTPPAPLAKYTITFSAGDGGSVSTTGGEYEKGQTVTVTATPQGEYVFTVWSDGNTDATRTITIDATKTITANFERKKYPLTVNIEGEGEVLEEIVNAGRTTDYNSGTTVKLTAVPSNGWTFVGWTGTLESTDLEVQLLVSEPKEINAKFLKINITALDAEKYLRDGTAKKTNRISQFSSLNLEVLYSENFAIWWDKATGLNHYADAVDILKWSELSFEKSVNYASNYRPSISKEYYINIYIHHPSYNSGEPDGFPDWGQWVGGEQYGGINGPYVAFPYDYNVIEIIEYAPRMNVPHEIFHVIDTERPSRILNGGWWREATASLFELDILSENPDPNSYFRGKHGLPSLIMVPHFSPWYAPNRPNGPGEWDLWSAGVHKYQTSYLLRFLSQNSSYTIDDILAIQFKETGTKNVNNGYYYYEPIDILIELLGREVFENLFVKYVKAVSDLSFLNEYEKIGYLRSLEDVLRRPIEDKRISLTINTNGEYSPNYKNQALSWTVIQVNGKGFSYEVVPDEFGNEGTKSDFHSFVKEENGISFIYVINTSDKVTGGETFDYKVTINGL